MGIMNSKRVTWALIALKAFQDATGADDEDAIADLLCDLRHLCDVHEEPYGDFAAQFGRANANYEGEVADDE